MRDYGKVHTSFWSSPNIRSLSDDGRTMALYLLTCPHGTIAGVFRLPDGYACEDLKWSSERVCKTLDELFRNGFSNRCETTKWVWVRKHLEWNPPENPNQRKAAAKIARQIPDECAWKPEFTRVCGESLGIEPIADREPLHNPSETLSKPEAVTVAVTGTEVEEEKAPVEPAASAASPAAPADGEDRVEKFRAEHPKPSYASDVERVFAHWQAVMKHPQAKLGGSDSKRYKAIAARLRDGYSADDLCRAVDGCRRTPHNMGQNDRGEVYDDIELICRDQGHVDRFIRASQRPDLTVMTANGRKAVSAAEVWLGGEDSKNAA